MRIILIACLLTVLLAGCVSLRVPAPSKNYQVVSAQTRQQQLRRLNAWDIRGALSVQQGGQADIANYTWRQSGAKRFRISLSSSLNFYQIYLLGRPGRVTLWQTKKDSIVARSPERLLQKTLGWSLPISNLFYWIRGLALPGAKHARYDRYGHLTTLHQRGWFIQYGSYVKVDHLDLPQSIKLQRGKLKMKIVVKRWSL